MSLFYLPVCCFIPLLYIYDFFLLTFLLCAFSNFFFRGQKAKTNLSEVCKHLRLIKIILALMSYTTNMAYSIRRTQGMHIVRTHSTCDEYTLNLWSHIDGYLLQYIIIKCAVLMAIVTTFTSTVIDAFILLPGISLWHISFFFLFRLLQTIVQIIILGITGNQ